MVRQWVISITVGLMELTVLVDKIAKKLEEEAKWAGQIKVTGIREIRAIGTAR